MLETQRQVALNGASWPIGGVRRVPAGVALLAPCAATAYGHVLATPCHARTASARPKISILFRIGRRAMLAKGARRLKEPST